jgi:hypothetical protein
MQIEVHLNCSNNLFHLHHIHIELPSLLVSSKLWGFKMIIWFSVVWCLSPLTQLAMMHSCYNKITWHYFFTSSHCYMLLESSLCYRNYCLYILDLNFHYDWTDLKKAYCHIRTIICTLNQLSSCINTWQFEFSHHLGRGKFYFSRIDLFDFISSCHLWKSIANS